MANVKVIRFVGFEMTPRVSDKIVAALVVNGVVNEVTGVVDSVADGVVVVGLVGVVDDVDVRSGSVVRVTVADVVVNVEVVSVVGGVVEVRPVRSVNHSETGSGNVVEGCVPSQVVATTA